MEASLIVFKTSFQNSGVFFLCPMAAEKKTRSKIFPLPIRFWRLSKSVKLIHYLSTQSIIMGPPRQIPRLLI
ncbi:TPA: hypothetical protein DEA21_04780 [Candidatus Uhrbacteria bacterium]|nr:hypothetical protein [Candidatus Uhrbacteria bacterium]